MKRHNRRSNPTTLITIALGLSLMAVSGPSPGLDASSVPEWSQPENLGPDVNSASEDLAPHLSSDGLALYFASTRPGSLGGEDLWVSRRASRHDPWSPATNLGPAINTAANERSPALSLNRRLLFFATDRTGGSGGFDLWLSWRADPSDDAGWQPPVNLGTAVNTAATDAGPSFLEVGRFPHAQRGRWRARIPQLYMSSNRPGGPGGLDIYLASVPGGWAGPSMLVGELSSPQPDLTPTVRADGLEIVIASGRPGTLGAFDLWRSVRKSVDEPWSAPTSLGSTINTEFLEVFPSLSVDARTLLFQSNRPGGLGGSDLYLSTR
jgi:Tol biopolymer transport system component